MNDSAAVALLVVLAVAYVGGAAMVVANLGKILHWWWTTWRARTQASDVDEALCERATAAIPAVAAAADVDRRRPM